MPIHAQNHNIIQYLTLPWTACKLSTSDKSPALYLLCFLFFYKLLDSRWCERTIEFGQRKDLGLTKQRYWFLQNEGTTFSELILKSSSRKTLSPLKPKLGSIFCCMSSVVWLLLQTINMFVFIESDDIGENWRKMSHVNNEEQFACEALIPKEKWNG